MSSQQTEQTSLPLVALRDVVVYPYMQIALFVGRQASVNAIEQAKKLHDGLIFVVAQKDSLSEEIDANNLYRYGTVCRVVNTLPHENDKSTIKVLIEGLYRAKLENVIGDNDEMLVAKFSPEPMKHRISKKSQQEYKENLISLFAQYAESRLRNARELLRVAEKIDNLEELLYFIATRVAISVATKQQFLEKSGLPAHLDTLIDELIQQDMEQSIEQEIQEKARQQMENNQREYFLNEKMKAIKAELGQLHGEPNEPVLDDEDDELEKRLQEADLPEVVRKKAENEFRKLKMMPPASSESSIVRTYIEWILDTPWQKTSTVSIDLPHAQSVLDTDHYGLKDVKDRILEFLAVQSRVDNLKGPILCLVGPPGVGKTSLGESIARATGREFIRMALGGVRDEAEIRGHRRTYIGAMPGKIVQSLSKVGVKNPLFLLDEIDKMAQDFRGDPASALLEVLDPSQNHSFNDHYLDMDLDLSQVMFICTANSMDIPPALLDRMEIIRLSGYTEDEKINIADKYLVPKAIKQNGLFDNELDIDTDAIQSIVQRYTREAGVRNLEREINKIARKVVKNNVAGQPKNRKNKKAIATTLVNDKNIHDYLGVAKYDFGLAEQEPEIGRITGLAWTQVGGELLTIETVAMQGKGELSFTGSLGDVMKESIKASMTVVKARGESLGISYENFKNTDIHVHIPEGATPKDGPSAGIALTTALASAMTGIAIRPDIAMTGEVTLRGKVLRIGGLKEKLLAAHRGGIRHVLIPKENERDLVEIPEHVKQGLIIEAVETIDQVFKASFVSQPIPLKPKDLPVDNANLNLKS